MNAICTIGSPPEMVRPPSSERSAGAKLAEPVDHLLRGDVGSVLQMPGIGIVAIGAAQQAARHEQHDPQAGPVVAGGRLVGMDIAEGAFAVVAEIGFVRRVGRDPDAQIVPAAGLEVAEL